MHASLSIFAVAQLFAMPVFPAAVPNTSPADSSPHPEAVVQLGRGRFTVLASGAIRMQYQLNSSIPLVDGPASLTVVNRYLPVPAFTVYHPNSSSLQVRTELMQLTFVQQSKPDSQTCGSSAWTDGMDANNGDRTPKYPQGASAANVSGCCALCAGDEDCETFVFATDSYHKNGVNCYLLMNVNGVHGRSGRVLGGIHGHGFQRGFLRADVFATPVVLVESQLMDGAQIQVFTSWEPGDYPKNNLNGTFEALDCYSTPGECIGQYYNTSLKPGFLNRDGWTVIDDSRTTQFDPTHVDAYGLQWFYNAPGGVQQDEYLFGYATNFKLGMYMFIEVTGRPPLMPNAFYNVWWSRYYTYSQDEYVQQVLQGYAEHDLPLTVAVMDMDWHTEIKAKNCNTWGGYDFNEALFHNNSEAWISYLDSDANPLGHPLPLVLNLHPTTGVDHCQLKYPEIASLNGIDPITNETVKCSWSNTTFTDAVFGSYLDVPPLNRTYAWTDDTGCGGTESPLLWQNYLFDMRYQTRTGNVYRPMTLSRNGGKRGNHRYPVGFSGDTFQSFVTLDFEVRATQWSAAEAMTWSHDIGGFHTGKGCPGDADPNNATGTELLVRWVQFGAVAPIFRSHCNHCNRYFWEFSHFPIMQEAFHFRNAMYPYIRTAARLAYDTGIVLVHPLYMDFPQDPRSYGYYGAQYMFGADILAAPVSVPANNATGIATTEVYLPVASDGRPNAWCAWNSGKYEALAGGQVVTVKASLSDVPLFVRAGSMIPMQTMVSQATSPDPLVWAMMPICGDGGTGSGSYYEDDGKTLSYYSPGNSVVSLANYTVSDDLITVVLHGAVGSFHGYPATRQRWVRLISPSIFPKAVIVNDVTIPRIPSSPGWSIIPAANGSLAVPGGTIEIRAVDRTYPIQADITIKIEF